MPVALLREWGVWCAVGLLGSWAAGCTFDDRAFGVGGDGASPDATSPSIDAPIRVADGPIGRPDAAALPDAAPPDAAICTEHPLGFIPTNLGCNELPLSNGNLTVSSGPVAWILDADSSLLNDGTQQIAVRSALIPQTGGQSIRQLAWTNLTIVSGARLRVVGSAPVAMIATASINVDGQISADAVGSTSGPGAASVAACADGDGRIGPPQTSSDGLTGGAGGGGGGYGSPGAPGGRVNTSSDNPTPGGVTNGNTELSPLRGGCRGGRGGEVGGGFGGGGGGAVQLLAANKITVRGSVSAAGGGGEGVSDMESGGGGGGAGGALLLEAFNIDVSGAITANGGGGGEGSQLEFLSDPGDGGAAQTADPAAGGAGVTAGGDGGRGGSALALAMPGGEGVSSVAGAAGGGGGGGSVGRIRIRSIQSAPALNGTISPVPTIDP